MGEERGEIFSKTNSLSYMYVLQLTFSSAVHASASTFSHSICSAGKFPMLDRDGGTHHTNLALPSKALSRSNQNHYRVNSC